MIPAEEFILSAMDVLAPETRAAGAALAGMELCLGRIVTPEECIRVAEACGAPRAPVLALFGHLHSSYSRRNRHAYTNVRRPTVSARETVWPTDRETIAALAISRTLLPAKASSRHPQIS
ncbi:MAG: hypothetical protein AAFY34_09260 [Pseudomonadota bacterium]